MIESTDKSNLSSLHFDEHGFMTNKDAWTPEIGIAIAAKEDIELIDQHWEVIDFARADYIETGKTPKLRRIAKNTDLTVKDLYQLFPGGPAKLISKVSGLPFPTGCI